MIDDLKTVKSRVKWILAKHERARDSDKFLWLVYLYEFHGLDKILGDKLKDFANLILDKNTPTMESVRRVRQKYQEDGFYHGKFRQNRLQEAENVREFFKKK